MCWRSVPATNNLLEKNVTLEEYFVGEPRGAKTEMAQYLGISDVWLSMLIRGKRRASASLCKKIEKATQGLVKRKELRPDIFA
jgi:DNA-binding transcriptional regulator YdaS (Cro superfamily)